MIDCRRCCHKYWLVQLVPEELKVKSTWSFACFCFCSLSWFAFTAWSYFCWKVFNHANNSCPLPAPLFCYEQSDNSWLCVTYPSFPNISPLPLKLSSGISRKNACLAWCRFPPFYYFLFRHGFECAAVKTKQNHWLAWFYLAGLFLAASFALTGIVDELKARHLCKKKA